MRDVFWNYNRPTETEVSALWTQGILVPDTNVLLTLYKVSSSTRSAVLEAFQRFDTRVFLPHQVGVEFYRLRLSVISDRGAVYNSLDKLLRDFHDSAMKAISQLRNDAAADPERLKRLVNDLTEGGTSALEAARSTHDIQLSDAVAGDPVLTTLHELFAGRTGTPYPEQALTEIRKQADLRYEARVPPGYKDSDKTDGGYGDYIIWRQLLDLAQTAKTPILFVTDDTKEDWYWREKGVTIGPRPELRAEMRDVAGVPFYAYTLRRFLEHAGMFQPKAVSQAAIAEVGRLAPSPSTLAHLDHYRRELQSQIEGIDRALAHTRRALDEAAESLQLEEERQDRLFRSTPAALNSLEARRQDLLVMQQEVEGRLALQDINWDPTEAAELEKRHHHLSEDLAAIEREITTKHGLSGAIQSRLRALQRRHERLLAQLAELEGRRVSTQTTLEDLRANISALVEG